MTAGRMGITAAGHFQLRTQVLWPTRAHHDSLEIKGVIAALKALDTSMHTYVTA